MYHKQPNTQTLVLAKGQGLTIDRGGQGWHSAVRTEHTLLSPSASLSSRVLRDYSLYPPWIFVPLIYLLHISSAPSIHSLSFCVLLPPPNVLS